MDVAPQSLDSGAGAAKDALAYGVDAVQQALDQTSVGEGKDHVNGMTGAVSNLSKRDGGVNPEELLGNTLSGVSVPVANQDLLSSLTSRWAEEYDQEMAKRTLSSNGKGQRPRPRSTTTGECSVGKAQCCNQVISDESKKKTLAGLLGFNSLASGSVGLNCQQIPILGVSLQSVCKATPVCCTNVTQDGLVNIGCTSIPIN